MKTTAIIKFMKCLYIISSVLLLSLFAQNTNICPNPSAENDIAEPFGWPDFWGHPGDGFGSMETDPEYIRDGDYSLRLEDSLSGGSYTGITLALKPDEYYLVQCYIKFHPSNNHSGTDHSLRLRYTEYKDPTDTTHLSGRMTNHPGWDPASSGEGSYYVSGADDGTNEAYITNMGGGWYQLTTTFHISADYEHEGRFDIWWDGCDGTEENYIWVDDVSIVQRDGTMTSVEDVTFTPSGGTADGWTNVSLSCATPGAVIRYTLDGTDPFIGSTIYEGSFYINSTATIKAKAYHDAYLEGGITSTTITINSPDSSQVGVPYTPFDYSETVDNWWSRNVYNPDSVNYIPPTNVVHPANEINVAEFHTNNPGSTTAGFQEAIDHGIATYPQGFTLWIPKAHGDYVFTKEAIQITNYYGLSAPVLITNFDNVHFISDGARLVSSNGGKQYQDEEAFFQTSTMEYENEGTLNTPQKNIMFEGLIFDGGTSLPGNNPHDSAVAINHTVGTLFYNCEFTNFEYSYIGAHHHPGLVIANVKNDHLMFVDCKFQDGFMATYADGIHGAVYQNCYFGPGFSHGGLLFLPNTDVSEHSGYARNGQFIVVNGCTLDNSPKTSVNPEFAFIKGAAGRILAVNNTLIGPLDWTFYVDCTVGKVEIYRKYTYGGSRFISNFVTNTDTFMYLRATSHPARHPINEDYLISNNTVYLTNAIMEVYTRELDSSYPPVDPPLSNISFIDNRFYSTDSATFYATEGCISLDDVGGFVLEGNTIEAPNTDLYRGQFDEWDERFWYEEGNDLNGSPMYQSISTPVINPTNGYYPTISITMTNADGGDIYYTTNGNVPTTSDNLYSSPLTESDLDGEVSLTVRAFSGSDYASAITEASYIIGNKLPVADAGTNFSVIDTDDNGEQTVSLDGSASTDSDGSITSYKWTTNGVEIATGDSAVVTLPVGTHSVVLTVTDNQGDTGSDTIAVTVNLPGVGRPPETAYTFVDTNGTVVMEAENATAHREGTNDWDGNEWIIKTDPALSGQKYVQVQSEADNCGDDRGARMDYKIYFSNTGTFEVHVRMMAFPNDSGSNGNSFWIGLDGTIDTGSKHEVIEGDGWKWEQDGKTIEITSTGIHTFSIWHREKYMNIDKIVLTSTGVNPSGNGPDESPVMDPKPIADAGSDILVSDNDENGSENVTFDGSGSSDPDGGSITNFAWSTNGVIFTSGAEATNQTVLFPAGTHIVTLTVTDNEGYQGTDMMTVKVNRKPVPIPGTTITITDSDDSGDETVTLDGTGSYDIDGTITNFLWLHNATNIAFGTNQNVTLPLGTNTVTLTVTDHNGSSASSNLTVKILSAGSVTAPIADAGTNITVRDTNNSGSATVTLDGSGSSNGTGSMTNYVWTTNGGLLAQSSNASLTASIPVGSNTVWLSVRDTMGLSDSNNLIVTVNPPIGPMANAGTNITVRDTNNSGNATVTLDGSGSSNGDGLVTNYSWSHNGTNIATGTNATTSVTLPVGANIVTLTVYDNIGLSASNSISVTVLMPIAPTANAGGDRSVYDSEGDGETVTLDGSGSSDGDGLITNYLWSHNGTNIATGTNATTSVTLPVGTNIVTLTVCDNIGLTASNSAEIVITSTQPPTAVAGADYIFTNYGMDTVQEVTFTLDGSGSSKGDGTITNWEWFTNNGTGDVFMASGTNQITTNVISVGTNTITLKVTDGNGLFNTDTLKIILIDPVNPTADAGEPSTNYTTNMDVPVNVTLNGSGSSNGDGLVTNYSWSTNGVTIASGTSATTDVTLPVGTNIVTLTVSDDFGKTNQDTVTAIIKSAILPTAHAGNTITNWDLYNDGSETISLNGSGSSNGTGLVTNYSWSTNGVTIASGASATNSVTLPVGTNIVTLTVCDDFGLFSSANVTVIIQKVEVPIVSVTPNNEEKDIALNENIVVTFSDSMNTNSVFSNISVEGNNGDISGLWSVGTNDKVFTFIPGNNFSYGETVTITINKDVRNTKMVSLEEDVTVTFTTELSDTLDNISLATPVVNRNGSVPLVVKGLTEKAKADVYSLSGTFITEMRIEPGRAIWNIINADGNTVAPGVYLIMIHENNTKKVLKAVITP